MTSDRSAAELVQELATMFDEARVRVATYLKAQGAPPTLTERRMVVEDNAEATGWQGSQIDVDTNLLRLIPPFRLKDALQPSLEAFRCTADALAQGREARLPLWQSFVPSYGYVLGFDPDETNDESAAGWVLAHLLIPATWWYLAQLRSVEQEDRHSAKTIATELLDVLTRGRVTARQTIAIEGVQTIEDVIENGSCRLRKLTPLERGSYRDENRPSLLDVAPVRRLLDLMAPSHVLEVDSDVSSPTDLSSLPSPRVLPALQLHGIEVRGIGMVGVRAIPEWIAWGTMIHPIAIRTEGGGGKSEITVESFARVCATAERLASFNIVTPGGPAELALHRFVLGCSRSSPVDGLLDFVIALEALLLPYDNETRTGDLSYRFRMHGAHFISDFTLERRAIFRSLRELYAVRSRLVHGGGYPAGGEVTAAMLTARALAARGLSRALETGFPDAAAFNQLLLGAEGGQASLSTRRRSPDARKRTEST